MDYSIPNDEYFSSKPSFFGKLSSMFVHKLANKKTPLSIQIDGLRADYAMAMDYCQMMKQHIQDLECKLNAMTTTSSGSRPDVIDHEAPYSAAIVLAKRGCNKQEIQEACGLTDSEADLILTLHNKSHIHTANNIMAS